MGETAKTESIFMPIVFKRLLNSFPRIQQGLLSHFILHLLLFESPSVDSGELRTRDREEFVHELREGCDIVEP